MNLSGLPNYSREVGIMRNPGQNRDVMNKLVFTYPFGIDQSLANLPFNTFVKGDSDTVGDALRSFFSVSVLKEILISNTLNLVKTASTFQQRSPGVEKSSVLINSLIRGNSDNSYNFDSFINRVRPPDDTFSNIDSITLQNKLNQKFDQIKQSVKADPRLKKLLPFMQIITLQNMLDVPVITGTFPFQLDTSSLFALLATAIATRTELKNWGDVRKLVGRLKSMPDINVNQMIDVLTKARSLDPPKDELDSYSTKLIELNNKMAQATNQDVKNRYLNQINELKANYSRTYIANLKDTKMAELERNLMFMMDTEKLAVRFGLSNETSQASFVAKKVNPQTEMLFNRTRQQFLEFLGGADVFFSSVYMLFSPIVATDEKWGETFLGLKAKFMDFLLDNFDPFMADVKAEFSTSISSNIEESSLSISAMNKSCETAREDFVAALNLFNRTLSGTQIFPTFDESDVGKFSNAVDKIVNTFSPILKNTQQSLIQFLGRDNASRILEKLNTVISNSFNIFFGKFYSTNDPTSQMQARLFALQMDSTGDLLMDQKIKMQTHTAMLNATAEAAKVIAQTIFLMIFKLNLCDFVEVADVEFGIAKNDVLDLPNYVLAIPLEIAQALFVIYTTRNWQKAVEKSGVGFNPLNMSYIKGIVKLLKLQLGIPNLFIFDKKKSEVYYSFQYMGASVEKIKMQALEVFVKHHLQDKSLGVSQVYY